MYRGECNITHNGSKTRLYRIWKQMRIRCYCESNPTYRYYGERGISICDEWNDFAVFRKWALENGYEETLTIERKDFNGNYCPENCEWIPMKLQCKNTRNCKYYEHDGLRMCHNDWARYLGINPSTLTARIRRHGVSIALSMEKGRRYA